MKKARTSVFQTTIKTCSFCALITIAAGMTACQSGKKQGPDQADTNITVNNGILDIDQLLLSADSLNGQKVNIEGLCTHICRHGGGKIFLMGSDDTQTIRVEAGKLGSFDNQCVNQIVQVEGILTEQRIDEAYLQQWEEQIKTNTAEKHGEDEGGCSTEKKARGEKGNTAQERINDFRNRIAKRQAAEGKAYLSFYFVEATAYHIKP